MIASEQREGFQLSLLSFNEEQQMELLDWHKWLVDLRRYFHRHPELGFQEHKTSRKIRDILDDFGISYIYPVAETGIVATLEAKKSGPVRAFRTDMDALPIEEQNNVSYKSNHKGIMHACGHDGHITIALGIIRNLVENNWNEKGSGKIIFFFQPAEEGGGGAEKMLATGMWDSEDVCAIYAFHMNPGLELGMVGVAPDVSNAASEMFEIKVSGSGGHGAHPHVATDTILASSVLITQLHHIISRSVNALDSAVISVGSVHAGSAPNILPSEAVIAGTVRTFNDKVEGIIHQRMEDLCKGIERAYGCKVDLSFSGGYPVLKNNKALVKSVKRIVRKLMGRNSFREESPRMGSEDFAYFASKWPGVLIYLGCAFPDETTKRLLHSPFFDFDERVLDIGVKLGTELLLSHDQLV